MALGSLPSSFLRRLSLVPLLLAIIGGIFGMHVLAGHHVQHGSLAAGPAVEAAPEHAAAVDAHGTHAHSAAATSDNAGQLPAGAACSSGDCATMHAAPALCILSAAAGSLAAPPPGTSPQPHSSPAAAAATAGGYPYLPGTPTPAELCISRT